MNSPDLKLVGSNSLQKQEIPSFEQWLLKVAKRIKTFPGASMFAATILSYGGAYYFSYLTIPERILPTACGIQCLTILGFIFVSRFSYVRGFSSTAATGWTDSQPDEKELRAVCGNIEIDDLEIVKADAARALRHYHNYWMVLWLAWLLLYAVFTFMNLPAVTGDETLSNALKVAATFLNNCAALALLYCYLTLSRPELLSSRGSRHESRPDWPIWVAILFVLTMVEATLVGLATAKQLPLHSLDPATISAFFGWISGINSAVVMFLYTRRLASRFMDCPVWVIVLLCAYAALQPGYGVLGHKNIGGTLLLLNFALVLKTLLFLYMTYMFRYGWLLCYFVQVAQFKDSAKSKMESFSRLLE